MDSIIEYFSAMPTAHRSAVLIGGLTIFFLIENAAPLFRFDGNKLKHTTMNVFFTFTTVLVNFAMAFILISTSDWVTSSGFGILNWLDMPAWGTLMVGLLFLDFFSAWLAHFTQHKITWMWQFHIVHHTDQYVDTTTANRHHPGESVIRFLFTCVAVLIAGAPIWLIFLYQSMSVVLSQFSHSNLKIPLWLDDIIVWVFCTPNMHRVHHHYRQPYSDSNYGNIFSFWDRIFGTFIVADNSKLVYGLDTHMDPQEADNVIELLKVPFKKYRPPMHYHQEEVLPDNSNS